MTAKEKANDLVDQYRNVLMNEDTDCGNEILCSLIAIKNAQIAVDEIIHFMEQFGLDISIMHQYVWWHNVKKEIDLL